MGTLALDMVENLIEARYNRGKQEILKRANLRLEKIRGLLRFCHEKQFISPNGFEFAIRGVDETSPMLGDGATEAMINQRNHHGHRGTNSS